MTNFKTLKPQSEVQFYKEVLLSIFTLYIGYRGEKKKKKICTQNKVVLNKILRKNKNHTSCRFLFQTCRSHTGFHLFNQLILTFSRLSGVASAELESENLHPHRLFLEKGRLPICQRDTKGLERSKAKHRQTIPTAEEWPNAQRNPHRIEERF